MKKVISYLKEFLKRYSENYFNYICTAITILLFLFAFYKFPYAFGRLLECFPNFGTSVKYYVSSIFDLDLHGDLPITRLTEMPFTLPLNIPANWDEFVNYISNYWDVFLSADNFNGYLEYLSNILLIISKILMIVVPLFILFLVISLIKKDKINNDYNKDSKALVAFKKFELKIINPVVKWIKEFVSFILSTPYKTIWIIIIMYQFNLLAIIADSVSYLLYFSSSFDRLSIFTSIIRLLMDLSIVIDFIPTFGWIIIVYIILCKIRKNIGYKNLEHFENMNKGFIKERSIITFWDGTMGSGKTEGITDCSLSANVILRSKAFEKIKKFDLMFPNFPWILLEKSYQKAIERHSVFNLLTTEKWVARLKEKFEINPCNEKLFGYDFERYGLFYDDGLSIVSLFEALTNYLKAYFIYICQSSLLLGNYSIRTDSVYLDSGNFPMWDDDFFRKDVMTSEEYTRYSHILDYDALRLGKKIIYDNKYADFFEFGVVVITEIGKERLNNLELQGVKKGDEEANQKNDLFNHRLKIIRHNATIDGDCFVIILVDDQRPESWGADARDLCELVHNEKCKDYKLAMPFFALEDLVLTTLIEKHENRYYKYRFERGDNTLFMHLYHRFISYLNNYHTRIYNTFLYRKKKLLIESGKMDGETKISYYYLMHKKIRSKRYSTDAFSGFLNEKVSRSIVGINDIPEFDDVKASFVNLDSENSYFFRELKNIFVGDICGISQQKKLKQKLKLKYARKR